MGVAWTKEQQQVIELRDRSLLVSAAAGSGKTAVLVQRIIDKICDETRPVDIDRLLVVTFTNAAAGEMKQRVQNAIEEKLAAHPENANLRRQEILAGHARITTIDSFCLSVLREHFQEAMLDPAFRIGDEGELKLIREDVLSALLEEEYQNGSEAFMSFMEAYAPGKDDERAAQLILELYGFSMANPRPEEWLDSCREMYFPENFAALEKQTWMKELIEDVKLQLEEQAKLYERMLEICRSDDGPESFISVLEVEKEALEAVSAASDYSQLRTSVNSIRFGTKPRKKKTDTYSDEKARTAWEMRDKAKSFVRKLQDDFFADDEEMIMIKQRQAGVLTGELVRLTKSFTVMYTAAKRKKNLVDFSDLEHLALEVLSHRNDKGEEEPTETAAEYRECFEEIMIDEYQDSNYVQELILTSIAKKDNANLFMVGDVKQSIYRFRLARPELFMEKYETYTTEEGLHQKIELHKNFRSREEVLAAVNYFFYQLMQKQVGRVCYDAEAALYPGREYAPCEEHPVGGDTEIMLLDLEDVPEDTDIDEASEKVGEAQNINYSAREWEAAMIADKIKELTSEETGTYVWDSDEGKYRLARFSDIAILLRTVSGWAEEFIPVLQSRGIPAAADSGSGYFSAIEVQTALNLLEIIDNPLQDIPLAAVMHSPVGGFSSEELALIRNDVPRNLPDDTKTRSKRLYDAVCTYMQKNEGGGLAVRLRRFTDKLEAYRKMSSYMSLRRLLDYVLEDTGYYNYVCAMPGASVRKANLDMLSARAEAFEKTSYQGVFQFVRYINKLKKYSVDYVQAQGDSNEDQVRIMSIHKSKGLEFPICITAGLGKSFNRQDTNAAVLFHADYGIGTDVIDPAKRVRGKTLMKEALRRRSVIDSLGEELRVLYVAMTRAKEKLILCGARQELYDYLRKCLEDNETGAAELPYHVLSGASRFLDWVIRAAAKHSSFSGIYKALGMPVPFTGPCFCDPCPMKVKIYTKSDIMASAAAKRIEDAVSRGVLENWNPTVYSEENAEFIRNRFDAVYDYDDMSRIHAAFSVSELKKQALGEDSEPAQYISGSDEDRESLLPMFMQTKTEKMSGAERGTLYHRLFAAFDYAAHLEIGNCVKKTLEEQLREFRLKGYVSGEEAEAVRLKDFERFAESRLGERAAQAQVAGRYRTESSFILGITAAEMFPEMRSSAEQYLSIQGVIDAWFEDDEGIVLIDFKTDRLVCEEPEKELVRRYREQLYYYTRALEQLTGKKVEKVYLYSISMGKAVDVEQYRE